VSDSIGRIPVPVPTPLPPSQPFPLVSEYGYGFDRDYKIIEHRFGELATMAIQRYALGAGARKFHFVKSSLSYRDQQSLLAFFDAVQGSYKSFTYPVPNTDRQTFTNYQVVFDTQPLTITELANRATTGITFLEILDPSLAPTSNITSVSKRFPSTALASALQSQVQAIVPLIHIKVRNPAVPDIYLSDRRIDVYGFPGTSFVTFLPRLINMGIPGGGDVIMSQSIDGRADNVRFTFGNADRVMAKLVNDCSLEFAEIDLSLLHYNSGALLQLWKGLILSWQVDGSPQFSVECSDGLYPVTQQYPARSISRQCWKPFDKAVTASGFKPCPYSGHGSGPGDPTTCDYFFNSPNGCLAHGMSNYFGGHAQQPQGVVIKDNGTGIWGGFFRSTITSTSILSDSIYGKPLAEIWCNHGGTAQRAFWANCLIAAVRDESDFEDILGIIGAGPLGGFEGSSIQTNADGYKFVVSPTADGFYPQGFKVNTQLNFSMYLPGVGLRQSSGNDPAHLGTAPTDGADAFSLGAGTPQNWSEPDANWSNIPGVSKRVIPYAAGTALCEMRYTKSAGGGVSPTTAESHNMQVPIAKGLTGATFDASGNRTLVPGVINPFWVAANCYFRALAIDQADAATQVSYLVLNSITNASGTGCADIAAIFVPPIVGTPIPSYALTSAGQALTQPNLDYWNGTFTYLSGSTVITRTIDQAIAAGYITQTAAGGQEPQFMFQGTIAEFKPFRDWLQEILNCAMGYYCFEFGALKLGIRYSAVPTDTFGLGSMLYQSLALTPIPAKFEYLKVSFANMELQYQQDLAEYQDKDHALYYGRGGCPLTSSMRSVGCPSLSQGLRVAVSRTREEIGGIMRTDLANPYIEWDNHKRATFRSTLLALSTEVGQVISIQHPDVPTYPGAHAGSRPGSNGPFPANTWPFRIQKWMLHSDWSVTIVADSVVDSMYDTEVGPQPTGAVQQPLPVMYYPMALPQWAPYQVQANAADAVFPNEWTFDLSQVYEFATDGSPIPKVVASGRLPVNQFIPNCGAVDVKVGEVTRSTTGGTLPGGATYYVQICATDAKGRYSPPSEVLIIQVPNGTNTNQFTIQDIHWPPIDGLTGYVVFFSDQPDLVCGQLTGSLTGGASGYTPTAITVTAVPKRSTYAVPDPDMGYLNLKGRRLIHGGPVGAGIDKIAGTIITSYATIDSLGTDNWNGRALAIIGRGDPPGKAPFAHFMINNFVPSTGEYLLDRDPVLSGVQVGDVFAVMFKGYDNSANPYVIGDPGIANATNPTPHAGETPNDPNRIGNMVIVIQGKSRGMSAKIVSNTATDYTLDQPLPIDATSFWIVAHADWEVQNQVRVNNADPTKTTSIEITVNNYNQLPLLIGGVTADQDGVEAGFPNEPLRMIYITGAQGTVVITS